MNLSKRTLGVLKIFASINPHLKFAQGKVQRTIAADEGLLVVADLDEEFPRSFPVCELSNLIRNYEAFENAVIDFGDKFITITDGGSGDGITLNYGAEALIKSPPDKSLDDSSVYSQFKISKLSLSIVMKLAEINSLTNVYIGSDGSKFYLAARDKSNPDSTKARVVLGDDVTASIWEESFTYDRFSKLTSDDYEVKVIRGAFASFAGKGIKYFIAVEK